jgi:glutathione S-transferase
MKLYYSPGACSLGPHIVLRELKIPHELRVVKVADRANYRAEFLAINPRARVPALEVDGEILTEAPALVVYLASLKPDGGLLPPLGSKDLARALEWLNWATSVLHIAYAQHWRPNRFLAEGVDTKPLVENGKKIIERLNDEIEQRLVGPWLLGGRYSVADCFLLAFYRWGGRIALPMAERYPRWTEWSRRMIARPAVREAVEIEGIGYELFGGA